MATIKGQNLRVLLGDDDEHLACVAASTSCQIHLVLQVEEDTTKDTEDDWIPKVPIGINWNASVDALVLLDNEETGVTVNTLQVGRIYKLYFSHTAGATGESNRDTVFSMLNMSGDAILSDLQITAQNGDVSTYTAQFTGTGELDAIVPTPNEPYPDIPDNPSPDYGPIPEE